MNGDDALARKRGGSTIAVARNFARLAQTIPVQSLQASAIFLPSR